jgi:dephospho-CoA kinase
MSKIVTMYPFPGKSVIGLTGGIACGKSSVLEIFAKNGWEAISTDKLAGEILTSDEQVADLLLERWGKAVFDERGIVDKKQIAEIIFSTPHERSWLEEVLHPRIRTMWMVEIETVENSLLVVEIPLLFENDLQSHFVQTISTFSTRKVQLERLRDRGLSTSQANARIAAQLPGERKAEMADVVFLTSGSLDFLERQVLSFLSSFSHN